MTMPHVTIEYFPRDISDEAKQAMAAEVTAMLNRYMGVTADAVSVDLVEVAPDQWKQQVYEPRIRPHLARMVMKPGYSVD
jgi:4-oxalocrotonate tautomerase